MDEREREDSWVTTSVLLDRLLDFQDSVWPRFCGRFRQPLLRFAFGRGLAEAEAEEVTQEALTAFLTALREGRYERGKGRLRSFLFGIANHKTGDALRRAARHPAGVQADTGFLDARAGDCDPREAWEQAWERSLLEQSLATVQREVQESTWRAFEATALESRDPAEVAAELGLTRNAVFLARHRVTNRLRRLHAELDDDLQGE